ncbi:hypothetical protein J1N35_042578 [Gossypium stocksii]|uniref:Uncharacterized protein n=1 Tax=Gossypium stocksii TaxID=47602 RepID=A0A9D3U5R0_9ROSI|nr:hypothetical protein J1N35_042578 [Gossypium stocksii]
MAVPFTYTYICVYIYIYINDQFLGLEHHLAFYRNHCNHNHLGCLALLLGNLAPSPIPFLFLLLWVSLSSSQHLPWIVSLSSSSSIEAITMQNPAKNWVF